MIFRMPACNKNVRPWTKIKGTDFPGGYMWGMEQSSDGGFYFEGGMWHFEYESDALMFALATNGN